MSSHHHRSDTFIALLLIVILAIFIFFLPHYGWALRNWLSPSAPASLSSATDAGLLAENQVLQAEIATYSSIANQIPTSTPNEIRAMVYSRYPLNFKNQFLVSAGADNGVTTGSAVLFQGVLVGQVLQTFAHSALVQTVFDSTMKIPVRIGTKGSDGLLEGGPYPVIGSIAKTASISTGDVIYSAASGIPYGIPIGQVAGTSTSPDNLFTQATINFSYDLNDIQTVLIAPAS